MKNKNYKILINNKCTKLIGLTKIYLKKKNIKYCEYDWSRCHSSFLIQFNIKYGVGSLSIFQNSFIYFIQNNDDNINS